MILTLQGNRVGGGSVPPGRSVQAIDSVELCIVLSCFNALY